MFLNLSGIVHSLLFLTVILSSVLQIKLILKRLRSPKVSRGDATSGLHRGYFLASLTGFILLMSYGFVTEELNYYLIVTRAIALVILIVKFFLLWLDTRNTEDTGLFALSLIATTAVFTFILVGDLREFLLNYKEVLKASIFVHGFFVCLAIYLQGEKVRSLRNLGGLSMGAQVLSLFKDVSSVVFAIAMGSADGFPMLVTNIGFMFSRTHIFKVAKCIEK